jgi:quercetin dioxygenase-like cupin family protein/uncharacterized protein YndB with AHSA1/START domain
MVKPGDVIEVPDLNLRFEFRETAESTGGAYSEFDVVGNPRGVVTALHTHKGQTETHTVIEGTLRVKLRGQVHVLHAGDTLTIPPDAAHWQRSGSDKPGRVRIRLTPSNDIDRFLERLGQMKYRAGYPVLRDGVRFIREFGAPVLIDTEYTFVDEWHVDAPPEDVFDVLADGTTYPQWWKPVYLGAKTEGEYTLQHFKGRLPYHLHTRTRTTASHRPYRLEGETDGDLRGTGIWTLTPTADGGTDLRFDWRVHADRRLLKLLTPVLRPALRWNHNWAIARAIEGLEPDARSRA